LPPTLEGCSIVHLSDLHFTGRVGKPFFQEIVRMSNDLEPDLVALTGDLVDGLDVSNDAEETVPSTWPSLAT